MAQMASADSLTWLSVECSVVSLYPAVAPCKSCCLGISGSRILQEQAQVFSRCGVTLAAGFCLSLDGAWLKKQLGTDERKSCFDSSKKQLSKSVFVSFLFCWVTFEKIAL